MEPQARSRSRYRDTGPVFGSLAPEVIEEALIGLAAENRQHLSQLPQQAGRFKDTRIVEFIFLLSEKWHLNQAAKYQAVELLERFMIKQVEQSESSGENIPSQEQGSSWSCLKGEIYDTFVLRLVSCVQLASKLTLHYNVVSSDTALQFLQSLKHSYTKQELLESELTVLKTLHFQVNVPTPLAYVELLLEVLGHNGCLFPARPLHEICVQLLDFCCLSRDAIYHTLLQVVVESSTPSRLQVAKFVVVKEDLMLLAVGIISTSVFIFSPGLWTQVVEHLNWITGITSESILEFSYAVLKHLLGSPTPRQHK